MNSCKEHQICDDKCGNDCDCYINETKEKIIKNTDNMKKYIDYLKKKLDENDILF